MKEARYIQLKSIAFTQPATTYNRTGEKKNKEEEKLQDKL